MPSKRDTFALFFPQLPLDATDRQNILTSGVQRIYLHFHMAHRLHFPAPNTVEPIADLQWLASQGRRVILRIEEPDANAQAVAASYYNPETHPTIKGKLADMMRLVTVEAVTIGNEPEHEFTMTRGHDWGNQASDLWNHWKGKAGSHADAVKLVKRALKDVPVQVITPGWSHRRKVPKDLPEPGRMDWARVCTVAYNECHGGGVHLYGHDVATLYKDGEDYNRLLWAFGNELERVHTRPWILEVNTMPNKGTQLEHMQAVCRMYDILTEQARAWGVEIGAYVPFTSNGVPGDAWPANFLMRTVDCYQYLATWMSQ